MAPEGTQHSTIIAGELREQNEEHDRKESCDETSSGRTAGEEVSDMTAFPEGGARAWAVAAGTAGALFCTFGYCNAFG
jgi:hypothetical protein